MICTIGFMTVEQGTPGSGTIFGIVGNTVFQDNFLGINKGKAVGLIQPKITALSPFDQTLTGVGIIRGISNWIQPPVNKLIDTAVGVFSLLDFEGLDGIALRTLQGIFTDGVAKQAEIPIEKRKVDALFTIGLTLMPLFHADDSPITLINEMNDAREKVLAYTPSITYGKFFNERINGIVTCYGLSVIQHSPVTGIIEMYRDNPSISRDEVASALTQQNPDTAQSGKIINDLQLVYLYSDLLDPQEIANATGIPVEKVQHSLVQLENLKLFENPTQQGFLHCYDNSVTLGVQPAARSYSDRLALERRVRVARNALSDSSLQDLPKAVEQGTVQKLPTGDEIVDIHEIETNVHQCDSIFGSVILDCTGQTLSIGNQLFPVTRDEQCILQELIDSAGQTVLRSQLFREYYKLHGGNTTVNIMIDSIRELRKKLDTFNTLIETVRRKGFQIRQHEFEEKNSM